MATVLAALPDAVRKTVVAVLEEMDQQLLNALQEQEEPTSPQRERVEELLCAAFCAGLGADDQPIELGCAIDDAVGIFLVHWPIEHRQPVSNT